MTELPAEVQVQQAVNAVEDTIAKHRMEVERARRLVGQETRKRLEAEAELKRVQEQARILKGAGGQLESMFSAAKAVELDDMFSDLDKSLGSELNIKDPDNIINLEKYLKAGQLYVDNISNFFKNLGNLSELSDAEFVSVRYRYLMDSQRRVY